MLLLTFRRHPDTFLVALLVAAVDLACKAVRACPDDAAIYSAALNVTRTAIAYLDTLGAGHD